MARMSQGARGKLGKISSVHFAASSLFPASPTLLHSRPSCTSFLGFSNRNFPITICSPLWHLRDYIAPASLCRVIFNFALMLALFPHFRELARIEIYLLFARNCNKWNARLHSRAWQRQPGFYSSLKRKTKHKNEKKRRTIWISESMWVKTILLNLITKIPNDRASLEKEEKDKHGKRKTRFCSV